MQKTHPIKQRIPITVNGIDRIIFMVSVSLEGGSGGPE